MAVIQKTVLVEYSCAQMFALVDKVEDYPQFLPWCGGVDVQERQADKLVATLHISYHGLTQSFTTENRNAPPNTMVMTLVEGPFKHFEARWHFTELAPHACKVEFDMNYEFSSKLLDMVIGPVFNKIGSSFVDAFCQRAEVVYG